MESTDWEGFVLVSSDTVVGIVGAVILTGAMIAVFYYENSNANGATDQVIGEGDNLYTIQWVEESHAAEPDAAKFTKSETTSASESYPVSIPNFTSEVVVKLTWSDDETASQLNAEDTFRVELVDPAGEVVATDEDASGELTLTYTVPDDASVAGEPSMKVVTARGDTEADAEAAVKTDAGSVEYTVRVTLVDTNSEVPDPLGDAAGDTQNSFELLLGYTHWHAWEETRVPAAE